MFGFFLRKQQQEVQQVLARYMNRDFSHQIRDGQRRDPRGAYCQPAWLIPILDSDQPDFDGIVPLITKDISREGLSLIHQTPIDCRRMLVALGKAPAWDFLFCALQHSTPVGLGYYQTGVHAERVLITSVADLSHRLEERTNALQLAGSSGGSEMVSGLT